MNRKIILVSLMLLGLLCACVKKEGTIETEGGETVYNSTEKGAYLYRITAIHTYNSDKEEIRRTRCTYDENGNINSLSYDLGVSEEVWNAELNVYEYVLREIDGKADQEWICTYDEKGTVDYEKRIDYREDDSYAITESIYTTEYDRSGYLVSLHRDEEREYKYTNNAHGYPLSIIEKYIDIDCARKYTISYLADGRINEIIIEDQDGNKPYELFESIQFEYAEDGKLHQIRWNEGEVGRYEFVHDKNGRLIEIKRVSHDNEVESRTEFSYDKMGRLAKKANYNEEDSLVSYSEFEYEEYELAEELYQELIARETWQYYMELLELRALQRGYWCSRYAE